MFQTTKLYAAITHINFRKENHGDEKRAAVDISVDMKDSALLLDTIDPKLRKTFFEKPPKGEQQPLPIDGNNLTALSLPYLREQKLNQKYEGYEVEFHSLLEKIEPLFFADAKVKIESVTFIEGGSIDLSLKVSFLIEDDDDAPLLAAWRRGNAQFTCTPPEKQAEDQKEAEAA